MHFNPLLEILKNDDILVNVTVVNPGFINFNLSNEFLASYIEDMSKADKFGYNVNSEEEKETIVIDFGGANVAKPLHVGHLRSAIIGESIKRINRYVGNRREK